MSLTGNNILAGSSGQATGYDIDQSLRFNEADSAALYRTNAAGNRKTATWSVWVKAEAFSTSNRFMFMCLDGTIGGAGNEFAMTFPSNDCLELSYYSSGSYTMRLVTNQVFRDPSAWYHILCNIDTTQAASSNRAKIYVNGSQVTSFSTETYMAQDSDTSVNKVSMDHWIGRSNGSDYFPGYLAEYHFIDGTALGPESFGETDAATNQWKPIEYTGSYGTNGFYQKYGDPTQRQSFTTVESTTWTAPAGVTSVEYLVVAGGGQGGWDAGGGGGAGGYRTGTLSVTPGSSYTVTVGVGGIRTLSSSDKLGEDGDNSVFSSITATGGGGGGSTISDISGRTGGSGGGGGGYNASGGSGGAGNAGSFSPVEGYVGGAGASGVTAAGGGGGGSSGAGATGGSPTSAGGAGTSNSITGSAVTYAAGGLGIYDAGGGTIAGGDNTGDGGSGGGGNPQGGAGGSGIVVLKWGSGFGKDSSGEGNDFAETNLVATDQMLDTPTNNFATLNPLDNYYAGNTFSEGNLKIAQDTSGSYTYNSSTISMSSGKWYSEFLVVDDNRGLGYILTGISSVYPDATTDELGDNANAWAYYGNTGNYWNNNSGTAYGNTYAEGDLIGIALDLDNNKLYFSKNGTWQNSGVPTSGATGTGAISITAGEYRFCIGSFDGAYTFIFGANFGADSSFFGTKTAQGNGGTGEDFYYTPPAGYKSLATKSLPDPSIALPTDHFNTVLWSGDSSYPRSITGTGFATDLLWFKPRNQTYDNIVLDSVRGLGSGNDKAIVTNLNSAEGESSGNFNVSSFDSGGFTMASPSGTDCQNATGDTYVGWNWKAGGTAASNGDGSITSSVSANPTAGFSIGTFTTDSTTGNATIGHGLSQAPELILEKNLSAAYNWDVYQETATPSGVGRLVLNDSAAVAAVNPFGSVAPTSSVWTYSQLYNGTIGHNIVAYCFHSIPGYSKVGTATGTAGNLFVYMGFKPAFVMWKSSNSAQNWNIYDNKRPEFNQSYHLLEPNTTDAESGDWTTNRVDIVSNGFNILNTGLLQLNGGSGYNYIYYAVAESPFKYSNAR